MNQRNVEALTNLIRGMKTSDMLAAMGHEIGDADTIGMRQPAVHSAQAGMMARVLASWGVLVPSALTDEEALAVGIIGEWVADVRAELERIAKGEAA